MQKRIIQLVLGAVLLIVGIILLVRAHDMAHALGEQVQQAFTGAPSNRETYFQIGGIVLTIAGAVEILLGLMPRRKQ